MNFQALDKKFIFKCTFILNVIQSVNLVCCILLENQTLAERTFKKVIENISFSIFLLYFSFYYFASQGRDH